MKKKRKGWGNFVFGKKQANGGLLPPTRKEMECQISGSGLRNGFTRGGRQTYVAMTGGTILE